MGAFYQGGFRVMRYSVLSQFELSPEVFFRAAMKFLA